MKLIIKLLTGFLISLHCLSQIEYSVESFQLMNEYVLTTVTGPHGIYSSYLCEGNVNEFENTVFAEGDLIVPKNNRDNLIDEIDLGILPTDILYHVGSGRENVFVYGGSKIAVLDGDDHYLQLYDVYLTDSISIHNSTFMPLIPHRYQLCSFNGVQVSGRDFFVCAPESGELFIIEKSGVQEFGIFRKILPDSQSQVLSSSVRTDLVMNHLIWAVNYWDGHCELKKIVWNSEDEDFIIAEEETWLNDEIIDFEAFQSHIQLAFLNKVTSINVNGFSVLNEYNYSVDKIENNFGHIRGQKELLNLNSGEKHSNDHFIDYAYSSCYDSDNGWTYFTGFFDDEVYPGFKIINYNPDAVIPPNFHSFYRPCALDLKFNPNAGDNEFTICATGKNILMGFNNEGEVQCETSLDGSFGYRIAIDGALSSNSNGTLVACTKDGIVLQFLRTTCLPSIVNHSINVGTSSSLTCFNEDEKILYIFYNGDGAKGTYGMYDESTGLITNSCAGFGSFTDCIYNKPSNFVAATFKSYGDNNFQFLKIIDGVPIFSDDILNAGNCLTNYNECVYSFFGNSNDNFSLKRFCGENSLSIELNYALNSIEINKDEGWIYGTCNDSPGTIMRVSHSDFNQPEYFDLLGNNPVDVCYLSGIEKIYVAQNILKKIEIYNLDFTYLGYFSVNGFPEKIEYDPYQRIACIISESDYEGPGFNTITTVNCLNDEIINEKIIRRSDGYILDTINDQFYFHSNYPGINENGLLEYNLKSLDNFNNGFSNKVGLDLYNYSDIFLSKKQNVPSKLSFNYDDNVIYAGNYGGSSISKIRTYEETYSFRPGWNWLSFPRMERYRNEPFDVITLLERIDPWPPDNLYMEYLDLESGLLTISNSFGLWNPNNTLYDLKSSEGYKLHYQKNTPTFDIRMEGAKLDYETTVNLGVGENWVGYFLDISQLPEQCLPADIWNSLIQIKTQYWSMTKINSDPPYWFLQGKKKPFKYGDLVILKTHHSYPGFHWVNNNPGIGDSENLQTNYFTFEEKADYTPFYVETDSVSDIIEIAVLADGVVKGASVREPGDTLVEVKGYLEETAPGAVIDFETWNGTKSKPAQKGNYVVIDHQRKVKEKRTIYTGEKPYYYHVSLKTSEAASSAPEMCLVTCKPNPFSKEVEFSFSLNRTINISITIFDMQGNRIKTISDGNFPEGLYRFTWQGDDESGKTIHPGVYFYKIIAGTEIVKTDKIVMIK